MTPIDFEDAKGYYGRTDGEFTSIRKLIAPGESVEVQALDITKNHRTQFPIADKDYNMRVTLIHDGKQKLMDLNGAAAIRHFVTALYPNGPDKPLVPCKVKLTRRTERKKTESELLVERLGDIPKDSDPTPF